MAFQFDSRKCKEGDLFIALKGEKTDGHLYLEEVAKKGALAAIVSKEYQGQAFGLELIKVDSPLQEIHRLAKEAIKKRNPIIVAITGSVGKTTTKEFIATILKGLYHVEKTPLSHNSQITLPLFILNADEKAEVLVLEMGASHPGNLDDLLSIAPPDFAVLTHISHSHTEFFKNIEGVAKEKGKILQGAKLKAAAVSTEAMEVLVKTSLALPKEAICTYGDKGDFSLASYSNGLQVRAYQEVSPLFTLPFQAPHLQEDFLGAAALCFQMGLSLSDIVKVAKELIPFSHRFESIEKGGVTFIDDSYNASVASFTAAFNAMPAIKGNKKILVMGEMREMGDYSKIAHQTVGEKAAQLFDQAFCIGNECSAVVDLFCRASKRAQLFESKEKLKEALMQATLQGDVVLIKGANSFKLWEIIDVTTPH